MRASELEAWALAVTDAVVRGDSIEYDRIELKAAWPESPAAAARRLAAHANTAGGDTILWMIGLDERTRQVRGAEPNELANWLPAVQAQYRGPAPALVRHLVTFHSDRPIVAMLFDTDRAPYVVLNPASGKPDAGPVELEVPRREGARTRSARHEDLIRILVPRALLPNLELLKAIASGETFPQGKSPPTRLVISAELGLYLTPRSVSRVVIPFHHCECTIGLPSLWEPEPANRLTLEPPTASFTSADRRDRRDGC